MNNSDLYASAENYEALLEALKRRAGELEISYADLDATAGLPAGFAGKVFGPSHIKKLGPLSLFNTLPALGLRLTLTVDAEALHRYAQRGRKRNGNQARMNNLAAKCGRRALERALRYLAAKSWQETLAVLGKARAAVAAEQTAKAARKEAIEANKQRPASSGRRRGANGTGQQNGNGTAAYDAPIGDELEQIADAVSMRVSRKDGERRGRKRGRVPAPFLSRDQHTVNRRTQTMLLSKHAKAVSVAR